MDLSIPGFQAAAPAADLARVASPTRVHAPDARPGLAGQGRAPRRRPPDPPRLRFSRRRPVDDDDGPLAQAHRPPARPAQLRWNVGCSGDIADRLEERAERLAEESGRSIAVVGQSRGGSCARALAVRRPDLVEQVVTLEPPAQPVRRPSRRDGADRAAGTLGRWGSPGSSAAPAPGATAAPKRRKRCSRPCRAVSH